MNNGRLNRGLGRRIALSLGLFVIVGSLVLAWWLHLQGRKDSRELFSTLAEANAQFVVDSKLPKSEQLAGNLSRILKMEVQFRTAGESAATIVAPPSAGVVSIDGGREAVAVALDAGWEAVFVRPSETFWQQFFRRSMWVPLGVFWGLCLVLAWAISRSLVRPLVALAERIPEIGSGGGAIPGLDRKDEIGHLARTLSETQTSLLNEREKREAAERLALLGRMAAGLAHEIKNPVAAIQMHAQLLGEEGGESAGMIIEEGKRIEGLVNQWMFLARPEPPKVRRQPVRDCLAEVLDSVRATADHAGVKLLREIDDELEWEMDGDRMAQVFRNLAMNAIHAMPGGGELRVRVADGAVMFSDTGRGFSEEALARWGELFFSTKEGGMGIGLSVASEIVAAHGGKLQVANAAAGAVITVTL